MTDSNKAKEYGVGTALLVSTISSLLASILCMYWFCRMEKRFRHRLVMILIYGDVMRGTWLFVFAIISIAGGTVNTRSTFCQASGFLVQYGTQTCDYAVLMMALHSAIQVFYPSTLVSSDGLYPCRRYVYAGAFALPILMAGLAFINENHAYVSQGAFCTLPVRPFWYRLALTWVPRYIIILTIIGLAIAIYAQVGFEFRAYSTVDASFQSFKTSDGSTTPQNDAQDEAKMEDITFELTNMQPRPQPQRRKSSIGHDIFISQRQASSAPALSSSSPHVPQRVSFESGALFHSLPESTLSLIRSRPDTTRPLSATIPSGQDATTPVSPHDGAPRSGTRRNDDNNPGLTITSSSSSTRTHSPPSAAQARLTKQRRRVHRQLRLMFIYPIVYTLMWVIPFALHCMNYWSQYATHPVEFLRVWSNMCITLMGFADALIFSLREKPWRSIDNSDGSFWGSFVFVRRGQGDIEVDAGGNQIRGRGSHSRHTSTGGEVARIAAQQARLRLDLEREERLKAAGGRLRRDGQGEGGFDDEDDDEDDGGDVDGNREPGGLNVGDGKKGQVYDDNGLEDDTADTEYNRGK